MASTCTVCRHPDVAMIDALVITGAKKRADVADDFGLGYESLKRHVRRHVRGITPQMSRRRATRATPIPVASPSGLVVPTTAVETFEAAFRVPAMDHQRALLDETRDTLVLKGRQIDRKSVV